MSTTIVDKKNSVQAEDAALEAWIAQMEDMQNGMFYAKEDRIDHELERMGAWG